MTRLFLQQIRVCKTRTRTQGKLRNPEFLGSIKTVQYLLIDTIIIFNSTPEPSSFLAP